MSADPPDGTERREPDSPDWAGTRPLGRAAPAGLVRPGPRRRSRRPLILSAVAVVALLAGASVALAVTRPGSAVSTSAAIAATPAPSAAPSGRPGYGSGFGGRAAPGLGFGRGMGGLPMAGLRAGGFGALVHGQIVLAKPGGGYLTIDVQAGQVTAVSSTSITVKSTDGYTASYAVTSAAIVDAQRDGIGSIKTGDQAMVQASVSGSAATATRIADLTLLQQQR